MSYLGNTPTTQNFISGTDYFNGTGSQTAFTLSRTVNSVNDIQVTVNNVVQQPNSGYTISGTTLTFDQAPSAGTQNVYVRYLSTTTQVITPSQNTVSWNTLDSNIQQDLGVMYKNRIINGNMVINQRGYNGTPANQDYTLDRWVAGLTQSSRFTVQQSSVAPSGFSNSLLVTSSSAYSVTSGDAFFIQQRIEGFNTADLAFGTANARTTTLSFWVRSSLTGTFGGNYTNSGTTRSYPFSYTISSANTWEYKTITVPGDITGTWVGATNGQGLLVTFGLGVGSSLSNTAGAWAAGNFLSSTGATSVVGTNGATWQITGVQLEVGTQATAFSTAGGSYGAELALCQRYCQVFGGDSLYDSIGTGGVAAFGTSIEYYSFPLAVQLRATPSLSYSGNWRVDDGYTASYSVTNITVQSNSINKTTANFRITVASGLTTGRLYQLQTNNNTTARLTLSSEL